MLLDSLCLPTALCIFFSCSFPKKKNIPHSFLSFSFLAFTSSCCQVFLGETWSCRTRVNVIFGRSFGVLLVFCLGWYFVSWEKVLSFSCETEVSWGKKPKPKRVTTLAKIQILAFYKTAFVIKITLWENNFACSKNLLSSSGCFYYLQKTSVSFIFYFLKESYDFILSRNVKIKNGYKKIKLPKMYKSKFQLKVSHSMFHSAKGCFSTTWNKLNSVYELKFLAATFT